MRQCTLTKQLFPTLKFEGSELDIIKGEDETDNFNFNM